MAEGFDAYHVWLGIPPEEQPPSCYRLLGIPLFEERPEVIEHAADQRMAHLKSLAPGKHAAIAQKLLNEVAAARVRLLDPYKKSMYDRRLREERVGQASLPADAGARGEGPGAREDPVGPAVPDMEKEKGAPPARPVAQPPPAVRASSPPSVAQPRAAVPQKAAGKAGPTPTPADQPTATWAPLGKLGDYQLLEKLGEGGMGTVYKAIHAKLGRMVALKVLSKDRRWDQHAVARFDREMKAVGAVDHPNIVRATDAREVEGTRFLVMEYVEGLDLNALGRACHPIAIADVCEIVRQAALGLQEVHRHNLVHRDVKPSNLMVTPQGVVKLLDLGLARLEFDRPTDDEVTETGAALGTVDYMAPEQVSDSRSVDIRADIYSLGCTFYKLLSGRTPFAGPERKGLAERLAAHAREPVPPIRQFRGDVPAEVVQILGQMLEKDPNKRFSTPVEVADAVGPLATTGDLAALVARARRGGQAFLPVAGGQAFLPVAGGQAKSPAGKAGPTAVPLDHAEQAEVATAESRSPSSGTRFFEQIVEASAATSVAQPPSAVRKWRKNIPILISLGALGVFCLVALLIWAFLPGGTGVSPVPGESTGKMPVPRGPRQTFLVLQWPSDERSSAMLEINGQMQSLPDLALTSSANEIRVPLKPGEHKVVVHRLGYAPFEQTFTLAENKDVVLRPAWKLSVGQASLPVPSVGQASLPAEAKKEPSPVAKREPAGGQAFLPVTKAPEGQAGQAGMPVLLRRRELAARWNETMGPAETMIAAWDFGGAQKVIEKVRFDEPELASRLGTLREELPKLAAFKQRIIAKINAAQPPLKKFAIGLTGQDGDVLKADEQGITAKTPARGIESHPWSKLSEKALPKVLQLVGPAVPDTSKIPAGKAGPTLLADDLLTAGMLALAIGNPVQAEKHFEQARSLGANIDAHLAPLAEAALARAESLLAAKQFAQAEKALGDLEAKHSQLPWFGANKPAIAAVRAAAKVGIRETEAEKLYAEAVELFSQKELFDLKPLVEKLKTDYAQTAPVTDPARKPSFAELERAVGNLGKIITVRLDGKGDFTSIQAAINAAETNTVIAIEDNGPYTEKLIIPREKGGLTIRGSRPYWPVITSTAASADIEVLVSVHSSLTLKRLVLAHGSPSGAAPRAIDVGDAQLDLREAIVFMHGTLGFTVRGSCSVEKSVIITGGAIGPGSLRLTNSLWLAPELAGGSGIDVTNCTMRCRLSLEGHRFSTVTDSIIEMLSFDPGLMPRVNFCNVVSARGAGLTAVTAANLGRSCLMVPPDFRDPANLDYRLQPGSPCIGKASDGGDIGCRFTPEMIELCKVALDLRRRGILKF